MVVVVVVALCFMEFWNRRQAELQYDWDVADFEIEEVISTHHTRTAQEHLRFTR